MRLIFAISFVLFLCCVATSWADPSTQNWSETGLEPTIGWNELSEISGCVDSQQLDDRHFTIFELVRALDELNAERSMGSIARVGHNSTDRMLALVNVASEVAVRNQSPLSMGF